MKILYLGVIASDIAISALAYFLLVPVHDKVSCDTIGKSANDTASKYGIFPQEIEWDVHIAADGKIHPVTDYHKIDQSSIFSCSFSVIPNDDKDQFAYLSVFRNNDTGYVVALDDKTCKVIDAKPVPLDLAVCGP